MNLYELLSTKTHSKHYLQRYLRYIEQCIIKNNIDPPEYTEIHHIAPKANDLFPQYIDLSIHTWNSVELSAKQHIIAHIILSRCFYTSGSAICVVHYMCNVQNSDLVKINGRVIPTAIHVRYAEKAKINFYKWKCGRASYKDKDDNIYFLETNDPKIKELGLVGAVMGKSAFRRN